MQTAIIGAGAAGLAAAYDLARAGRAVTVFEAGEQVGGLAAGFKADGWDWYLEKFYHHWFANDDDILSFLNELGLGDGVHFFTPVTSLWHPQRVIPLDAPRSRSALISRALNVLSIRELPPAARLRFGAAGFYLTRLRSGLRLERTTAEAWSRRWVGQAAHDLIWKPMLIGKFGPLYDQVNMAWLWARIYKRTASLGTYQGGFQQALEDIAGQVQRAGAQLHLGVPVTRISPAAGGGLAIEAGAHGGHFDQALVTASPGLLNRITPDLPESYRAQLSGLKSMAAQCLIVALDRPLMADGTYWLNLPAASPDKAANPFPFLALVEHTNALPKAHYGGEHILYLGDYLAADHPYFTMNEDELAALYLPALRRVNPAFELSWVRRKWLFRAAYAQPVPVIDQSQHIPAIQTPLPGLFFASMSQVYPWDRGTNYAVEMGRRAARLMQG